MTTSIPRQRVGQTDATADELRSTVAALSAELDTLNARVVEVFGEPMPELADLTQHTFKIDGEVTLRDDLDAKDGDEVVIVLTARLVRLDTDQGNRFMARTIAVNSVEGQDVVSGPSDAEQRQAANTAWAVYVGRQAAARSIRYGTSA